VGGRRQPHLLLVAILKSVPSCKQRERIWRIRSVQPDPASGCPSGGSHPRDWSAAVASGRESHAYVREARKRIT
jgi:hypothetical protein